MMENHFVIFVQNAKVKPKENSLRDPLADLVLAFRRAWPQRRGERGGYGYPPAVTVHPVNSDVAVSKSGLDILRQNLDRL